MNSIISKEKLLNIGFFDDQIAKVFNMDSLRVGRHDLRDQNGWRKESFWVTSIWNVRISPSFDPAGEIVIINFDKLTKALFIIADLVFSDKHLPELENPYISMPIELSNWNDPVKSVLESMSIFPDKTTGGQIDGTSYFLRIRMVNFDADITFGIPINQGQAKLESALLDVGKEIDRRSKDKKFTTFLKAWEKNITHKG